jgi:hypothetical protein
MNCHVLYRTYAGENSAPRPEWYSKELCLRSMLAAIDHVDRAISVSIEVIHDGPLDPQTNWARCLRDLMQSRGEIRDGRRLGNAVSCLQTIQYAAGMPPSDMVMLVEDDYLWLPNSLTELVLALSEFRADYVTGYDHPVRYQPDYPLGADLPHWDTSIRISRGRHWRSQESTCMTFGALAGTFAADVDIFERFHNNGKGSPADRELFRELQGLSGPSRPSAHAAPSTFRLLLGPMPSLCTHAHLPWLAPCVDWAGAAEIIARESGT